MFSRSWRPKERVEFEKSFRDLEKQVGKQQMRRKSLQWWGEACSVAEAMLGQDPREEELLGEASGELRPQALMFSALPRNTRRPSGVKAPCGQNKMWWVDSQGPLSLP